LPSRFIARGRSTTITLTTVEAVRASWQRG
jgi:hypothetical protein